MSNAGRFSLTIPIYFSILESRAPPWFLRLAHWTRGRVNYCFMRYYLARHYFRVFMRMRARKTPPVINEYNRLHDAGVFMTRFNEFDLTLLLNETRYRGDTEKTENTEKGAQGCPGNHKKGHERGGKRPQKELNTNQCLPVDRWNT